MHNLEVKKLKRLSESQLDPELLVGKTKLHITTIAEAVKTNLVNIPFLNSVVLNKRIK